MADIWSFCQVPAQAMEIDVSHGALLLSSALIFVLAATAVPAEAADMELAYDKVRAKAEGHRIVARVDQASFVSALARYERESEEGELAVGRYLMWRTIGLFPAEFEADALRLRRFEGRCGVDSGKITCAVEVALAITPSDGRRQVMSFAAQSAMGPFVSPEDKLYPQVVRERLRGLIDETVENFGAQLVAVGILTP